MAKDGDEPRPHVRAGPELRDVVAGTQQCLLNEIIRLLRVAAERNRKGRGITDSISP
jgi:hypothetical protein